MTDIELLLHARIPKIPEWMEPVDSTAWEIAKWMVENLAFPFDGPVRKSGGELLDVPPASLMRALTVVWAVRDGETIDNISHAIEMDTGYVLPEAEALRRGEDGTYVYH